VHAPHREARCAGRQAFNRLSKSTHRKACGYPARTLPCLRFTYFRAYRSSASWEDPPAGLPSRCQRASNQVRNDHHRQQWTPAGQRFPGQTRRGPGSPRRELASGRRGRRRRTRGNARHVGQRVRTARQRAARSVAESCLLPGMRLQMNYRLSSRKRSLSFWRNHR
jgi:hypothetical protein